ILERLEFRTLLRQLPEAMRVPDQPVVTNPSLHLKVGKNTIIDSNQKAEQLKLGDSDYFYLHTRSAGKHGQKPEVMIMSLNGADTYTIDLRKVDHKLVADNFKGVRP